ncbi:hypothetical protein K6Q96_08515 [Grimontia kaedaensis]|uniref:Uncharacterized protein n=1 Tax=Grimontia kaedaensis TaxID=2872157 RepID=A0ABY4WYE6_9GAMM|nr:hypothetical protein [Grimontia kaedaensis]USH04014.1 hypothetical protein K6Q96_08515 [Grimontia kaedaensis]
MAAEKLTTGRLVQILVVMTVLIAAFIWRTLEYSESTTLPKCSVVAGSCSVLLHGETIEIEFENQDDKTQIMRVISVFEPGELRLLGEPDVVITSHTVLATEGEKRAYIYGLPVDVNYGPAQKWMLFIDQDQLEINF